MNEYHPDRLMHLENLRSLGYAPYVTDSFDNCLFNWEDGDAAFISGRIYTNRVMGKIAFITLLYTGVDHSLLKTQLVFKEGESDSGWRDFVSNLDTGDIVSCWGICGKTLSGEQSLFVKAFRIVSKSLIPVSYGTEKDGESFNTVQDPEYLMRNRHVGFLVDNDLRARLIARSQIINNIREYLTNNHYIEVQTPVLMSIPGGADAQSFDTHYNAYDVDISLRISLEISLKKMLSGGFDRVFEIGTVFRNEGISSRHNPEFTELEYYGAHCDFKEGVDSFKRLMDHVLNHLNPSRTSDIHINWNEITVRDAIIAETGVDIEMYDFNEPEFPNILKGLLDDVEKSMTPDTYYLLTHHPVCLTPLARTKDGKYAERFEAYACGMEIANGFCEQNDPVIQLRVLEDQSACLGTKIDQNFIHALACGMPPAFGVGIGIDRLVMALTDAKSIREVTSFPYVKELHNN
jgi:lysyl-tRNA synthetase, class II